MMLQGLKERIKRTVQPYVEQGQDKLTELMTLTPEQEYSIVQKVYDRVVTGKKKKLKDFASVEEILRYDMDVSLNLTVSYGNVTKKIRIPGMDHRPFLQEYGISGVAIPESGVAELTELVGKTLTGYTKNKVLKSVAVPTAE